MQREKRGDEVRRTWLFGRAADSSELPQFELGQEPVAALHFNRGHAESGHALDSQGERRRKVVQGGPGDSTVGREDAASGCSNVAVVAAGHADRVFAMP